MDWFSGKKGIKAMELVVYVVLALLVMFIIAEGITGAISANIDGLLDFLDALVPF